MTFCSCRPLSPPFFRDTPKCPRRKPGGGIAFLVQRWAERVRRSSFPKKNASAKPIPAHAAYYDELMKVYNRVTDDFCDIGDMLTQLPESPEN